LPAPWIYRTATRLTVPLLPLVLPKAQRDAHLQRLRAPAEMTAQSLERRDINRPLVWFHSASVGEGLQARAVLHELQQLRPDLQVAWTHYSPSAERLRAIVDADIKGYLGYDRTADVSAMLTAIKPSLLVYSKLDLWPELTMATASSGIPVAMVAATVDPNSSRRRWPSRSLTRAAYATLSRVGAVSVADGRRLVELGAPVESVTVTGDPRVDSVLSVTTHDEAWRLTPLAGLVNRHVLVAGSTWPKDEAVLLKAWNTVRKRHPATVLVMVPHQPNSTAVTALIKSARQAGANNAVTLSGWAGDPADVIVIDQVGMLASLYAAGAIAYVGGGFGRRGVHSVLEPAAQGRPVVIGPHDRGLRDAELLAANGGLVRLPRHNAGEALAELWSRWLEDPQQAQLAAAGARNALEGERGAAARSAALLTELLSSPASIPTRN
jgi:3-deoxy-D-manno-octulosonic-acid transferase